MKPSVVTDTTLPPIRCMLCKHSPTTLLINEVVQDASTGFDKSVPGTFIIKPVFVSKLFLLDIPRTTLP